MSYESAPSTQMLATHCFACGRALRDSVSVEIGMGPVCRGRAGYNEGPTEGRKRANQLIHHISLNKRSAQVVKEDCMQLIGLGFRGVARIVAERLGVVVEESDGRFVVRTPFHWSWIYAARKIPGRKFDKKTKSNSFPIEEKGRVYAALCRSFPNHVGIGPKGMFVVAGITGKSEEV